MLFTWEAREDTWGKGALQGKKNNLPGQGSFQQEEHEGKPAAHGDEVLTRSRGFGDSMTNTSWDFARADSKKL